MMMIFLSYPMMVFLLSCLLLLMLSSSNIEVVVAMTTSNPSDNKNTNHHYHHHLRGSDSTVTTTTAAIQSQQHQQQQQQQRQLLEEEEEEESLHIKKPENPCVMIKKDIQLIKENNLDSNSSDDDDESQSQQQQQQQQTRHKNKNDWYCELRGNDQIEFVKHFVQIIDDGIIDDEELINDKPSSGHIILPPGDLFDIIDGIVNLSSKGNNNNNNNNANTNSSNNSRMNNNNNHKINLYRTKTKTKTTDDDDNNNSNYSDDDDEEEEEEISSSWDNVDEYMDDLWIIGDDNTNTSTFNETLFASIIDELYHNRHHKNNNDNNDDDDHTNDDRRSTDNNEDIILDLTIIDGLDDAKNDGIESSNNNNNNNDDDDMSTGTDGFSVSSLSDYTGQNVFDHHHNDNNDTTTNLNDEQRRALKKQTKPPIDYEYNWTAPVEHTVLVVRVVANDTRTSLSRPELSNRIFGTTSTTLLNNNNNNNNRDRDDRVNLSERFANCSYGQLTMKPFQGITALGSSKMTTTTTTTTTGPGPGPGRRWYNAAGVINVRIYINVIGEDPDNVTEAVLTEAEKRVGTLRGQFDHVMLCLPPGTSGNWKAFSFIHHWLSVFNDGWCASPSAQVHQIGHNLGLGPSIEEYIGEKDQTGMMGESYFTNDFPRMCFSPARSWQLGWYPGKRFDVYYSDLAKLVGSDSDDDGKLSIRLVGIADYGVVSNDDSVYVHAKIHTHGIKYYLGFNRKKGINQDVMHAQDLVTVQAQAGKHHDPAQRKAILGVDERYTIPISNYGGQQQIEILVKGINIADDNPFDYAEIEISLLE